MTLGTVPTVDRAQTTSRATAPAPADSGSSLSSLPSPDQLGPTLPGEAPFPARIRAHQAWYRVAILGLETFGSLPSPSLRELGSVLDQDAARAGKNFTSAAAHRFYGWRRTQGWGVEPHRCTAVMTSSQALTLNIFGLLDVEPEWAARTFSEVLGVKVRSARTNVEVAEWGPLKHRTRMDAITTLDLATGGSAVLGWEIKLCDRYTSRNLPLGTPYADLLSQVAIWKKDAHQSVTRRTNALFRCHALLEVIRTRGPASHQAPFVLLRHDQDPLAPELVTEYRALLRDPSNLLDCPLGTFVAALLGTAEEESQGHAAESLRLRYLDLHRSESAWNILQAPRRIT